MHIGYLFISWDLLRVFYKICQHSSLIEAAKYLRVPATNLTRYMNNLESQLGYRVLNRQRKKGIKLLKEGRELRDLISPFYQNLAEYDARHQLHGFTFTTGKEQPSLELPLSYTSEAETPLSMHPQKTQVNSMALSKVMTTVVLLSSLFVQACSVGMALNGQKDPDLTVIKKGADRDEIEFQLGDPKKVSVVGGETITSYEYQLNNESSAGRAVAHGVMDLMTLGIWEVVGTPVEMSKGDKFELEIVYDQQNKVKTLRKKSSNN